MAFLRYKIGNSKELIDELEDNSIHLLITSPPYNIQYETFNKKYEQYEDNMSEEEYREMLKTVFQRSDRKLTDNAQIYINLKNRYSDKQCSPPFWLFEVIPKNWVLKDIIIWKMDIGFDTSKSKFQPLYEFFFWFVKDKENYTFNLDDIRIPNITGDKRNYPLGKNPGNVWYFPIVKGNAKERAKHPAQFPMELIERIIKASTNIGETVFDPFLGSGTVLACCRKTGRNGIGFEINPLYEEVIKMKAEMESEFCEFDFLNHTKQEKIIEISV